MRMQQGKPNCLCRSIGIRAKYCRRFGKEIISNSSAEDAPSCGRVALRSLVSILYARIMTPACASQHSCWPTHIFTHGHTFHSHVSTHIHTFTCIHMHSHTFTGIHTQSHTFTHIQIHLHIYTFTCTHTHSYMRTCLCIK